MAVRTAGMINFTTQLDRHFPQRKKPDGWIADRFHTGTSDHHPDDTPGSKPGWDGDPDSTPDVRGADISADLGPGARARAVCDHLARLPGLRLVVRYFIHAGLIWHVNNGFIPRPHTGDAHPTHIHVSFAWTESADDNVTFDYRFEEVPVALTNDDRKWILQQTTAAAQTAARDAAAAVVAQLGNEVWHRKWNISPKGEKEYLAGADSIVWNIPQEHRRQLEALQRIELAIAQQAAPPAE